jgi:hypothetical protein
VAVAACGLIDAAAWAIPAAALSMASLRTEHQTTLVQKHAAAFGRLQVWALFFGVTFAGNAIAVARRSWRARRSQ